MYHVLAFLTDPHNNFFVEFAKAENAFKLVIGNTENLKSNFYHYGTFAEAQRAFIAFAEIITSGSIHAAEREEK